MAQLTGLLQPVHYLEFAEDRTHVAFFNELFVISRYACTTALLKIISTATSLLKYNSNA